MKTITLSLEVFASHGNCLTLSYEIAGPVTTPHWSLHHLGLQSSQRQVTMPHRHTVIHNHKQTSFRQWRLQSKHLPPVLTVPQAVLTFLNVAAWPLIHPTPLSPSRQVHCQQSVQAQHIIVRSRPLHPGIIILSGGHWVHWFTVFVCDSVTSSC